MAKTPLDFSLAFPDEVEAQLCNGYVEGRNLDSPHPGPNRHPAYVHGFRNGRDDAECAAGLRPFPSRTAQQARDDLAYIKASLEE